MDLQEGDNADPQLIAAIAAALAAQRIEPALYIVATPIGNLADVTLRALAVLARADLVACEDTRMTRRLLERYHLAPRMIPYHEHNAAAQQPALLAALRRGECVALVSDAGTPLVSDPGARLVDAALDAGHRVIPVPGPSALLAALVVSGLPSEHFWFEGFLPSKKGARAARIAALANLPGTLILYEAPHRVVAALADLSDGLGERRAVLARELTKRFETVRRASLGELAEALAAEGPPKGEIVLLIGPSPSESAPLAGEEIDARLKREIARDGVRSAAASLAAETGISRRVLYQRALALALEEDHDD